MTAAEAILGLFGLGLFIAQIPVWYRNKNASHELKRRHG